MAKAKNTMTLNNRFKVFRSVKEYLEDPNNNKFRTAQEAAQFFTAKCNCLVTAHNIRGLQNDLPIHQLYEVSNRGGATAMWTAIKALEKRVGEIEEMLTNQQ